MTVAIVSSSKKKLKEAAGYPGIRDQGSQAVDWKAEIYFTENEDQQITASRYVTVTVLLEFNSCTEISINTFFF